MGARWAGPLGGRGAARSAAIAGAAAPSATRATVPSRNFFISLNLQRLFPRRRVPAPSMAGDRQLLHEMLSPIGHSGTVPNPFMELQFLVTNEVLMEPESGINFSPISTLQGLIRC